MHETLQIRVINRDGTELGSAKGEGNLCLTLTHTYEDGDRIRITCSEAPCFLKISADSHLKESTVWLTENTMEYPVPVQEAREAYPPGAFAGTEHEILVSTLTESFSGEHRLISENPLDIRGKTACYPHCTANAETRGEAVFAARNVIDGSLKNTSHGCWPYTSWGEDENPGAEIKIEFGRTIIADKTAILLRADFPHDNYWKQVTMEFSDRTERVLKLHKTGKFQEFSFPPKEICWVKLKEFVRSEEPSPFPALTEWEVYGWEKEDRQIGKDNNA